MQQRVRGDGVLYQKQNILLIVLGYKIRIDNMIRTRTYMTQIKSKQARGGKTKAPRESTELCLRTYRHSAIRIARRTVPIQQMRLKAIDVWKTL